MKNLDNLNPEKTIKELIAMLNVGAIRFNVLSIPGTDFRNTVKQVQLIYLNDNNEKMIQPIGKPINV